MIWIEKGSTPLFMRRLQAQHAAFDDMPSDDKKRLREVLLEEQGHLCAYCMSGISDTSKMKIEHILPRSKYPDRQIDYNNLVAVCCGGAFSDKHENQHIENRELTCDSAKGNQVINIIPTDRSSVETIYYDLHGVIYSSNVVYDEQINDVLNLNEQMLVRNRKDTIDAVKRQLFIRRSGSKYKSTARALARKYEAHETYMTPYVGVIRWYLGKKLKEWGYG